MKFSHLLISLLLLTILPQAEDIYVSQTTGDDSNDGTITSPFKSLAVGISAASSGDDINVKSGTYREKLSLSKDNITLTGIDDDVIITGADLVTNWESVAGDLYKSYQPNKVLQLFVDSEVQTKAKFPNQAVNQNLFEYTTFEMNLTGTTVTSSELTQADGYWDGATIWMLLGSRWIATTGKIVSSSTGELTLDYISSDYTGDGVAFITNSKNALDYNGEWSWQNDTLYFQTSSDISALTVEAKVRETIIDISNRDGIVIDNIKGHAGNILMDDTDNSIIKNSEFTYLSEYHYIDIEDVSWYSSYGRHEWLSINSYGLGIAIFGTNNVIDNCEISWSAGDGIALYGEDNIVSNSTISNANYIGTDAAPIALGGTGNRIEYNTIYNGGRNVISALSAESYIIKQNRLSHCGLICWDVGVFYTFDSDAKGAEISYNWVSDASSSNPEDWGSHCIYIDNNCVDIIIHHNVIWNSKSDGIRFNSPATDIRAYNNTIYNSSDMVTYKHPNYDNEEGGCKFYNNYLDANVLNKSFIENLNNVSSTTDYLANRDNEDFMPIEGSELIGAAIEVEEANVTAGEDIGAYNLNGDNWTVGPGSSEISTGILDDITYSKESIVYPNPVVDYLQVENNGRFNHYKLYNTQSQLIRSGEFESTIDLQDLHSAVYTIILIGEKENKAFRIYK